MACANHTAVSRQDFLALYKGCVDSGLRTRLILRHQAGSNEITISCRLNAPTSDASAPSDVRRRRCLRNRAPAAAATSLAPPPDLGIPLPTAPSSLTSTPQESPSPAETATPPAKRTLKAARHRCEVELLHDSDTDDELLLSPVSQARLATPVVSDSAPVIPPTPGRSPPMPTTSMTVPTLSPIQAESPAGILSHLPRHPLRCPSRSCRLSLLKRRCFCARQPARHPRHLGTKLSLLILIASFVGNVSRE